MVAKAGSDDFQQRFACVANKRNPSVGIAISSVPRFVKDLDDRKLPLRADFSCYPNVGNDVGKALLGECGGVDF